MRFNAVLAASAVAPLVAAFQNTSPFFLTSTTELSLPALPEVQTANRISEVVADVLEKCPTTNYLFISHPAVTIDDFSIATSPFLFKALDEMKSSVVVPEVFDRIDVRGLADKVEKACGGKLQPVDNDGRYDHRVGSTGQILYWVMDSPHTSGLTRTKHMATQDAAVKSLISKLPKGQDITIVYTTFATPGQSSSTELDEDKISSFERLRIQSRNAADDKDDDPVPTPSPKPSGRSSVFDRYTFMSAGISSSIIASIVLLLILYFGLNGILAIETSELALSKTMIKAAEERHERQKLMQRK